MNGDAKKKTTVNTRETEIITVLAVLIAVSTESNFFSDKEIWEKSYQ